MEIVTNIGQIALTDNQIKNWVPSGIWSRFSYVNGEVLGVSESQPQQSDIDALKAQLATLPDTQPKWIAEQNFSWKQLMGVLFATFGMARSNALSQERGTLKELVEYPNWAGVKEFLQSDSALTDEEKTIVNQAFLDQGIDLSTY